MGHRLKNNAPEQPDNVGVQFYAFCGKVFIACGIISFLLMAFVSTLPQDYEKYNIPLFFGIWIAISLMLLFLGTIILILCRKSKKFQRWAEKDVVSFAEHQIHKEIQREEKKFFNRDRR